jgi:S-adenosylmethionine:diacylglycerol 3-amino-3-carboxypropyl transferase
MGALRRRPLYSACNEDSRSELHALAPERGDTVVCIAAGGGRALALLGAGTRRFLAIDRRESQLHTLELKAAALDAFAIEALRAFLGVDADPHRLDEYALLRPSLTPRAQRYWDARRSLLRRGVLYAGRLETALARHSAWLRRAGLLVWPRACFAATTLDEQRAVLKRSAAEIARGERLWRAFFHPIASALALQDPSFRRSTEGRVGTYLYRRMLDFAQRRLLRESALLHLIYHGHYDPNGALPVWLTAEGAERARKHLARLEVRCASIEELPPRMLRDAPTKWSLSDVSAWMPQHRFQALIARINGYSVPGSRICWRHLAAQWAAPQLPGLVYDASLARRLEREDSSAFYTFGVAAIEERDTFPRCLTQRPSRSPTAPNADGCSAPHGSRRKC